MYKQILKINGVISNSIAFIHISIVQETAPKIVCVLGNSRLVIDTNFFNKCTFK